MNGFSTFWSAYPLKVGKLAAMRAFSKALRQATASELLRGVERYKATKPAWQQWAHPATWLNQGRWLDEVPHAAEPKQWACPDHPPCPPGTSAFRCHQRHELEQAKRMSA